MIHSNKQASFPMPEYQGRPGLAQISQLTLMIALNLIPPCGKSLGAGTENLCKSDETLSNSLDPKAIALKCPKRRPSIVSYGQINLLFFFCEISPWIEEYL